MATRIKEGMTGAEVAQIIDEGFDNLDEIRLNVESNTSQIEAITHQPFVSELMGIGTTKEEVNINYRGMSEGISFEFQRTIPSASSLNAGVMTAADKVRLDNTCTVFMLDVDRFLPDETYEGELTREEVSLLVDTYTKGGIIALWVDKKTTLYSDAIDITDGIITITFSWSNFSYGSNLTTLKIVLSIALDFKYTINSNIYEIRKSGEGTKFLSDDGTYKTIADEEDITAEDGNLKLKDRAYDADNFSGKGYKILRKNILLVTVPKFDLTINTGCAANGNITINEISIEVTTEASTPETVALLIQSAISGTTISGAVVTFTSNPTIDYSTTGVSGLVVDNSYLENRNILTLDMINLANTVYEIRYDFDLNGAIIRIPTNCMLDFQGGSFNNGKIFSDNLTTKVNNLPPYDENNDVFWGKFFDAYGRELTILGDIIRRQFTITTRLRTVTDFRHRRKMGINDFQFWLTAKYNDDADTFQVDTDQVDVFTELVTNYNPCIICLRLQAQLPAKYITGDGTPTVDSYKLVDSYLTYAKNTIDLACAACKTIKYIYVNNESTAMYKDETWTNAMLSLRDYVHDKGCEFSIAHNQIGLLPDNATGDYHPVWIHNNFIGKLDNYGINFYPKMFTERKYSFNAYNNYFNERLKYIDNNFKATLHVVGLMQLSKINLTESGFSSYAKGLSGPDIQDGGVDETGFVQEYAFKNLVKLLAPYSTMIGFVNLWSLYPQWNLITDKDIEQRLFQKMYNTLLTF